MKSSTYVRPCKMQHPEKHCVPHEVLRFAGVRGALAVRNAEFNFSEISEFSEDFLCRWGAKWFCG